MRRVAHHRNTLVCFVLAGLALVVVPSPAAAQGPGVRGGVSVDPDQFYVGFHYETTELVDNLYFRPNAELGFGDDLTLVGLNFEFVYKVPIQGPWTLYGGFGPAVNIYSFDRNNRDDTDAEAGLNVLFGAEATNGLFFEIKLGAMDSPDFKLGIGFTWH